MIALFFNIGGAEMFFIVLVVIMFFGAKRIPELARGLGKGMREIKNATGEIQREIKDSTGGVSDIKDKVDVKKQVENLIKDSDKEVKSEVEKEEDEIEVNEEENTSQPGTVSRSNNPYTKTTPDEK